MGVPHYLYMLGCNERLKTVNEVKMAKLFKLVTHILLYLQLITFVFCGPLPPYHLKCERSLAGLQQEQLKEVHRLATVATDNSNPLLSWTIQHTGIYVNLTQFKLYYSNALIILYRSISDSKGISSDVVGAS